jgi:hypothetical protein
MEVQVSNLRKSIRRWLLFFMISLVISGLTAIDVLGGIVWISGFFKEGVIHEWIMRVRLAIEEVNAKHHFIFYGYDWLAFAHLVIAVAFIGPYKDPVRNKWVIQFGRVAALMVIPFALIAGSIRGIPFWWQLVDCSFGIVALWPLSKCYWLIEKLEILEADIASKRKQTSKCMYQSIFQ